MATASVIEIIGGIDNDGGLNTDASAVEGGPGVIYDEDGNIIDPISLLWIDPEIGNHIYFAVAVAKIAAAAVLWWVPLKGGVGLRAYMIWAWAVGLLSVAIAWIPVFIGWCLLWINTRATDTIWLIFSLWSIIGPMIGYPAAIVITLIGYFDGLNSGLTYTSEWHFWLGMVLGICFDIVSITFQVAILPGIRVWHNIRKGLTPNIKKN